MFFTKFNTNADGEKEKKNVNLYEIIFVLQSCLWCDLFVKIVKITTFQRIRSEYRFQLATIVLLRSTDKN